MFVPRKHLQRKLFSSSWPPRIQEHGRVLPQVAGWNDLPISPVTEKVQLCWLLCSYNKVGQHLSYFFFWFFGDHARGCSRFIPGFVLRNHTWKGKRNHMYRSQRSHLNRLCAWQVSNSLYCLSSPNLMKKNLLLKGRGNSRLRSHSVVCSHFAVPGMKLRSASAMHTSLILLLSFEVSWPLPPAPR